MAWKNRIGEIYKGWVVIEIEGDCRTGGKTLWRIENPICKHTKTVRASHLTGQGNIRCLTCHEENYGKHIGARILQRIKINAKNRNIKCDLTREYLENLIKQQNYKCALSGIDIFFPRGSRTEKFGYGTASLDRIKSDLGYVEGNVQWVHKHINVLKNHFTVDEFIWLCCMVTYNCKDKLTKLDVDPVELIFRKRYNINNLDNEVLNRLRQEYIKTGNAKHLQRKFKIGLQTIHNTIRDLKRDYQKRYTK